MKPYEGSYRGRVERQKFAIGNFPEAFDVESVLDVGDGQRLLEDQLERSSFSPEVISLDLYGEPTILADLNQDSFPVKNSSVSTVVCLDVLEHLDQFHDRFDKCLKMASKYLLISLPNNSNWLSRAYFLVGKTLAGKHGLPPDPPDDRHRWLLNFDEATNFVRRRLDEEGGRIVREFPYFYRFNRLSARTINFLLRLFGTDNLGSWSYWCLIDVRQN